jgi:hypothetical protein
MNTKQKINRIRLLNTSYFNDENLTITINYLNSYVQASVCRGQNSCCYFKTDFYKTQSKALDALIKIIEDKLEKRIAEAKGLEKVLRGTK